MTSEVKEEIIHVNDLVARLADQLGETSPGPRGAIHKIVKLLGEERTLSIMEEALAIEKNGGMMTLDGK